MKQRKPLYILISEYLSELIENHKDDVGYKLPSEMRLCQKFECSRLPVRNAYELLERKNYIMRFQGKRAIINPQIKSVLNTQKRKTIAAIMPFVDKAFHLNIISGIRAFCNEEKIDLIVMSSMNSPESEKKLLSACQTMNCCGIILFPTDKEQTCEEAIQLREEKFPIVLIDRKFKDLKFSCVCSDHYGLLYKTVEKLKLRKNIVYVTVDLQNVSSVRERLRGFREGLRKFGQYDENNNVCLFSDSDVDTVERELTQFFVKHRETDAVIIDNGRPVAVLADVLKKLNLLQKTLKIALIDNDFSINPLLQRLNPLIVLQNEYEIGYRAAELLQAQMNGNYETKEIVLPIKIKNSSSVKGTMNLY